MENVKEVHSKDNRSGSSVLNATAAILKGGLGSGILFLPKTF